MSCKVSVVIPIYAVEKYLSDCLDSVLSSTLQDIEVLGVDDASPDRCPQILDEYAARDDRVKAVHLAQNGGQGIARNVGLKRACGEYVYFLDSDDMVASEALEKLYERASRDNLDCIFFDATTIYENDELRARFSTSYDLRKGTYGTEVYTGVELYREFEKQNDWNCYVQRQFWRREYLLDEDVLFPEAYAHEDEFFAFKGILLAKRVAYMPDKFFIRRYREGSVMSSPINGRGFYSYLDCFCKMATFLKDRNIDDDYIRCGPARIYSQLKNHYEVLRDKEDLRSMVKDPAEKLVYDFFDESEFSRLDKHYLSDALIEQAKQAEFVYIYGAGQLGKRTLTCLVSNGVVVTKVFVTDAKGNAKSLRGYPVEQFPSGTEAPEGVLTIIAITDGHRREIEDILDASGWPHAYCKDGW